MDFSLSVLVAGTLSTTILFLSLLVYYRRLNGISDKLTKETLLSLRVFGFSILCLVAMFPMGLIVPEFAQILTGASLFGMLGSQLALAVGDRSKMRKYASVFFFMLLFLIGETIARMVIVPYPLPAITMMIVLAALSVASLIGAIYVVRESPSPFTVSMIIIVIFTVIAGQTSTHGFISTVPQYFMLQILPNIVAIGITASMLKPWRNIITISMSALIGTVGPALFIPAFIAGNMTIFLFTISLTFALFCLIIPLAFFLQQAVETRASTALYISISLVSIGLLALTHGNNFSIAYSAIGAWDETILFIDWFFGLLGVSAFTMAAIASSFSANVRHASREIIIGIASGLLVLGHPIVRWVEFDGELIQRWELDPLYLGIFALLIIAFIVFFRVSYQLWKVGSGRAGLRFIFFMLAALFLGIVAMFADLIALQILVPLLLLSGVMLILSSPKKNPFSQTYQTK
ncbi:MAG: hypothetical protein JW779_11195 [Candidatus Thorarchaeota archaeon]|nr:hypothetical protein [Candidatus Thorarchaeota archaeon]